MFNNTPWCLTSQEDKDETLLPCRSEWKTSPLNGLRPRPAFPLVFYKSASVSQSWGVTPVSRTWGLVRDTASLRRHGRKRWVDEEIKSREGTLPSPAGVTIAAHETMGDNCLFQKCHQSCHSWINFNFYLYIVPIHNKVISRQCCLCILCIFT